MPINKLLPILIVAVASLLSGCIKNDIPYPFIIGDVLSIEVEGQTNVVINHSTRKIYLEMGEDIDIRKAQILKLELTENAVANLDISQPIDLSEPVNFKVTIFRDWPWTIETTQPIERYIVADNQVGSGQFDIETKTVHFKVLEGTPLNKINIREIKLGPSIAKYTPDPHQISDFSTPRTIKVQYFGVEEEWTLIASEATQIVQTNSPREVWGGFAIIAGSMIEGNADHPTFQYREKGGGNVWKSIDAKIENRTSIYARINGLKGGTTYEYRAQLAGVYGEIIEFKTEDTPLIPNMGFEAWTQDGRNWFPGYDTNNNFWSTGNEGVTLALAGGHPSNTFPTDDAVYGKAACLRTIRVNVTNIAAGSIFTGRFTLNVLNPTRSVRFGQPYTGRPTRITFWYKYFPKAIDVANTSDSGMLGEMDSAEIYVYLGKWDNQLFASDLRRENTPGVIAFSSFTTNKQVENYIKQEIVLNYIDRETIPSQIILVATPSKFGENFTGGIGSTLYLDEIEFSFD